MLKRTRRHVTMHVLRCTINVWISALYEFMEKIMYEKLINEVL